MGDVVQLGCFTTVEEPAEQVLEKAKSWGLTKVLVIGFDADGLAVGGSTSDRGELLFMLEWAKKKLMEDLD